MATSFDYRNLLNFRNSPALMQGNSFGGNARGAWSEAMGAIEFGGSSLLTGFLVGRYNEELKKHEFPIPLVVGAVLKLAAYGLDIKAGYGRQSSLSPHLHAIANGPLGAMAVMQGISMGHASKNQELYQGDRNQKGLPANMRPQDRLWGNPATSDVIGHIPQAPEGQWLDEVGLRHFAKR